MSQHRIEDLSFDAYRASNGVSASMLKTLSEQTPMHLKHEMENPSEITPAQRLGTLIHAFILTPDLAKWHVKPEGLDGRTKEGKAWNAEHQDAPIVLASEASMIEQIGKNVREHPTASRFLKNAAFEQSLFVDDNGITRKMRPDILPTAGDYLPDLKTCASAHPEAFSRAMAKYLYPLSGAYYLDTAKMTGREFKAFILIAVETCAPYCVAVYVLDFEAIEFGRRLYKASLETYRRCVESNEWPGYSVKPLSLSLPEYILKQQP